MMMNQGAAGEKVEKRLRAMRTVWGFFLTAIGGLLVFTYVVGPQREPDDDPTLFYVLVGVGVVLVASSFVLKGVLLKRAADEGKLDTVGTALFIALALCEGAVILGVVSHFVTGHPYSFVLFALGALGELLHFPRREQLLAAARGV